MDLRTFSRKTKIPLDVLEEIESGKVIPLEPDLARIADELGVDISELLAQRPDGVHKADSSTDAGGGWGLEDLQQVSIEWRQ